MNDYSNESLDMDMDNVNHAAITSALAFISDEIDKEYIYGGFTKTDKHNLPGAYKSIAGTTFDKTIYNHLLTAITGTSSNFESNPKKTCIALSIGICLNIPYKEQQNLAESLHIPLLTDEDKGTLTLIEKAIMPFSDDELFWSKDISDEVLRIRALINRATSKILMFKAIYNKVGTSYKQALQDAAVLQLNLDAEINQDNERNKLALKELDTIKANLKMATEGKIPVVFMDNLTYPKDNATCSCGHCGYKNDARNILRARTTNAAQEDYTAAYRQVFSQFVNNNVDLSHIANAKLIHNAGIITPIICNNCGALNIPSEGFLRAFKLCVLGRWIQVTPSPTNKDVMLTYSASTILDGILELLKNDQEKASEILQGYKPTLIAEKVEAKPPEYNIKDLVSSETYTNYLSMLRMHSDSNCLSDTSKRQQYFLQYMLSLLHISTVDASPSTVIASILHHPRFISYKEQLEEKSKLFTETSMEFQKVDLLHKVVSSEHFNKPMNGYIDMSLNINFLTKLIEAVKDSNLRKDIQTAEGLVQHAEQIAAYANSLAGTIDALQSEINDIAAKLSKALLVYEQELYNDSYSENWDSFYIQPLEEPDSITLFLAANEGFVAESFIFKCDTCNILWNYLKDAYIPLMYQTVIHFSAVLQNKPTIFNGLFFRKHTDWAKHANKMCNALGVDIDVNGSLSFTQLFSRMLYAGVNASSAQKLMQTLNISESRLLRSYTVPLPTNTALSLLNEYSALNDVDFPVELSTFGYGADIEDYQEKVKQAYVEELDTSISDTESLAIAECAAFFYITFSPIDTNKTQLQEQLRGSRSAYNLEI